MAVSPLLYVRCNDCRKLSRGPAYHYCSAQRMRIALDEADDKILCADFIDERAHVKEDTQNRTGHRSSR